MEQKIKSVAAGSIGEELGLEPGDVLLAVNGTEIEDVLDYYFLTEDDYITLKIRTKQGEEVECDIEKDAQEPLGLSFEEEFMGQYRHCKNKCIFCFIDQLPKGMRETLYFKDDDARLSFLNGNYITMTNMSEEDLNKIIRYHMSPMNVSVHTTNPDLRVQMLHNPRAKELMPRLRRLAEAGITLNGQIVLCKGVNDGEELARTVRELGELIPAMQSVSIVPVGLSRYREGLYPLEPFTPEDCLALIRQIDGYQQDFYQKYGLHFIHLSDEFYCKAGAPLPEEETYDGYLQIENGVGMMRLFWNEAQEEIGKIEPENERPGHVSIVTAPCAADYIQKMCRQIEEKIPGRRIDVHVIINHFFGENITVTGLLTGQDIIAQLKGKDLGEKLLLPGNILRAEGDLLLDDLSVSDIEKALQIPVDIVKSSGDEVVRALLQ
jgi:putative radical SAM enzyme (TIGR03279 family)